MRGLPLSKTYLKAFTFGNFPYMKQAQIRYFHNANSLASFTFLGLNYRVTVAHTTIVGFAPTRLPFQPYIKVKQK